MNIEQAIDEAAHASDARLRKSYEVWPSRTARPTPPAVPTRSVWTARSGS